MAIFLTSHPSALSQNPKFLRLFSLRFLKPPLSLSSVPPNPRLASLRVYSAFPDKERERDPILGKIPIESSSLLENSQVNPLPETVDEWGEKSTFEEGSSVTKLSEADPPKDEDEWGREEGNAGYLSGNGSAVGELKRCLVDSFYGTEYGFRATAEARAEIVELINQLEVANPTSAPMKASSLLDGNWILLYTAFSELLPLIAAGTLPLLKLKQISQKIETGSFTIQNCATFSSPFATFSFRACASFEVRSPSRIQIQFKEGVLQPPEISSIIDLPENINIFGQKIDLLPVQRSLNPVQEVVANILGAISGQPPLKVPIPGERAQSWLVTTFLDEDLRISRGDGGLFVLAKEGSPLLDYQ